MVDSIVGYVFVVTIFMSEFIVVAEFIIIIATLVELELKQGIV